MKTHSCLQVLVAVVLVLCASVALADDDAWQATFHPELDIRPTAEPIEIDGLLDDPGWQDIPRARHFSEHQPGDQVQPPVRTEVLLTYDDDYLYAAFICQDDPDQVRATFTTRDRIWSDDYVFLMLDTYGDQSWAYEIAANPYGIQGDLLWSAGNGEDMGYDLVYYTSGRITDHGWQVEMAVPWTSLRFPDGQEQEWRVDFWRNHPRDVRGQYSWAKYDRDEQCWPCQWGTVRGIAGVTPGSGIEILPAFVASQESARGDSTAWDDGDIMGEPGISLSYGISPTTTAEATINPDFSQVESDAAQINVNSTFALFYPEKRPFFQEGSDLWNTWFNVIYTRSINQPMWAAKVTGRPGRSNFAVMSAQDESSPFIVPFAEESGFVAGRRSWSNLVRYQRVLGEGSHAGVIFTDRRHEGGGSGTTYGADTRLRIDRNWQLELMATGSYTVEPDDTDLSSDMVDDLRRTTFDEGRYTAAFDGERFAGHSVYASLERNARHWNFDADYWARSPTWRAENGFEPRNDMHLGHLWTGYMLYFEDSLLERLQPSINGGRQWDFTGKFKDEWINARIYGRLSWAQAQFQYQYMRSRENFDDVQFNGIWNHDGEFHARLSDLIEGGVEASYGHRIARDATTLGAETNLEAYIDLKPMDRFKFFQSFNHTRSDAVTDGTRLFEGYVARTRLDLQLTREWSVRLVLQYNDFYRTWAADPLMTWRLNPFTIFYVGSTRDYAEFNPDESLYDGWRLHHRTYFLKAQYLFQL